MLRMVLIRLASGLVLLLCASAVIFVATEVLPGDVATAALGRDATPEALAALRERLDLDRPALLRYGDWIAGIVTLDLGVSVRNGIPVTQLIGENVRNSLLLGAITVALLAPLSLFLGTLAALRRGRRLDIAIQLTTLSVYALPEFVIGVILVLLFAFALPLLPAVSFDVQASTLVLPALTLLLASLAYSVRLIRAGVIEVLASEYVAMARLKGMSELDVIRRHVLPNALGPWVHAFVLAVAWLAGGVVIVETLFAYPGIGAGLVDAVRSRDATTVQAISLMLAAVYVFGNLLADIFTVLITPRIRTQL